MPLGHEVIDLSQIAQEAARVGGWTVNLEDMSIAWSADTYQLHEIEDRTWTPSFETAMAFYPGDARGKLDAAFRRCADAGTAFDLVLPFSTAGGRRLWVRVIGERVMGSSGRSIRGAIQDVSALVAAKDRSEALAKKLETVLESIGDAFVALDRDWRFTFVNAEAEKLLQRSRFDLLGRSAWDEFAEAGAFQEHYTRAAREQRTVRFTEYFAPLRAWFQVSAYPSADGISVYFRDVTQERARDEQLRLLEAAVSRQGDILIIVESKQDQKEAPTIVYVNQAFERQMGYASREAIGAKGDFLHGPKTDLAELNRMRAAVAARQPVRGELIKYTKAGQEVWLDIDVMPVPSVDGDVMRFVAVERDIGARKRAEAAERLSRQRFEIVSRVTSDVVWDWDLVENRLWWNDGMHSVMGYAPGQLAEGLESWTARIHSDDHDKVLESLDAALQGASGEWICEYRFLRADDTPATVLDRGVIIRDGEGAPVRMVGSMVDVTEKRRLESDLRQAQRLEAVGQLTGGIAHDFNNLLTVILSNAELLEDALADRPALQKIANLSRRAAEQGGELTSRLMSFSRRQPLAPKPIDLNDLLQSIAPLLRRALSEQVEIVLGGAADLAPALADRAQVESAVLNLCINARDAMPEGGAIAIDTGASIVASDTDDLRAGEYIWLRVRDTGVGMDASILARVFEPFFTTKAPGKGSGLGLSMIYGFAKQSNGKVEISSAPGQGTSVTLYLPSAGALAAAQPTIIEKQEPAAAPGAERILLVEDNELVRAHVSAMLSAIGYEVTAAADGVEALQILAAAAPFDLLFTDMFMPHGVSGVELALEAKRRFPQLKILLASGDPQNASLQRDRLGPDLPLLIKPYRRGALACALRELLDEAA